MNKEVCCDITRASLSNMRARCLRRGLWFRWLEKMERGIVDLTIRCIEAVRSSMLALTVARIIVKMGAALNQRMQSILRLGRVLAEINSKAAVSWGNAEAIKWKHDLTYMRCLGVNILSFGIPIYQQVHSSTTFRRR
jgi:hypothetical protein